MDISIRTRVDRRWWLVIALVGALYALTNLALPSVPIGGLTKSYVIQPILWVTIIFFIRRLPKYNPAGKIRMRSSIIQLAFIIGFFQVVLYAISGLFSGFGKSPSSFTPLGILGNLALFGTMLVGMELSRAWLLNHLGRHTFIGLAFVALIYTLFSIPLNQITGLKPDTQSIGYLNSTLLPALAESLLASLLALLAGPVASVVYRGILQAFWLFVPILPDLSWVFKGLVGTVVPIVGLVAARGFYISQIQRGKARRSNEGSVGSWVVTSVLSVMLIWFSVGVFPVRPTLIASGSMSPLISPGDVIIVAKMPAKTVKEEDIIEFRTQERITIVHRVIKIEEKQGTRFFTTKGDDNNAPDSDLVHQDNVIGKAVFVVPKVGWLAILVKGFFTR